MRLVRHIYYQLHCSILILSSDYVYYAKPLRSQFMENRYSNIYCTLWRDNCHVFVTRVAVAVRWWCIWTSRWENNRLESDFEFLLMRFNVIKKRSGESNSISDMVFAAHGPWLDRCDHDQSTISTGPPGFYLSGAGKFFIKLQDSERHLNCVI